MVLLIDNYDSFTYNLYQYFRILNQDTRVVRNDALSLDKIAELSPDLIVLSPGPGRPEKAGICLEVIRRFAGTYPVLGICLGMQAIAVAAGASLVRALEPVHGKVHPIRHGGLGIFAGLPNPLAVTRYHSLVVSPATLPYELGIDAETDKGEIMALSHRSLPLWGVQFHPEAVLTESGLKLLANALDLARSSTAG